MHPTVRVLSSRVHQPLIRFLGKRKWPTGEQYIVFVLHNSSSMTEPEPQHPHPSAPIQFRESFSDFLKKFESTASEGKGAQQQHQSKEAKSKSKPGVYENFWEAPSRVWKPRVREISKDEMDAIIVSGRSVTGAGIVADLFILDRAEEQRHASPPNPSVT